MKRLFGKHDRLIKGILLLALLVIGCAFAAQAAETNKALKIVNAKFADGSKRNMYHGAEADITLPKQDKLKASKMTFSCTVYIPAKALQANGDQINIDCYLYPVDPKDRKKDLGFIETKFDIILRRKTATKVELKMHDWDTNKESAAGKYASVKKEGSYYKVMLKNLPFNSYIFIPTEDDYDQGAIDTKTPFELKTSVLFVSSTKKGFKANLYVDDLKVKTAKLTQTVTFDKKDYKKIEVSNWASGNVTYKLTAPMK